MNEPTMTQIIEARNRCARIISLYGERYLPIFERLEKEIAILQGKKKLMEKALKIATQNGTHFGTHLKRHFTEYSK